MRVLVLNGSPRKNGTVAGLLKLLVDSLNPDYQIDWVDVYDLKIRPCFGCMKCRLDGECVLPPDDGQLLGKKIKEAQILLVGTPTFWANMSAPLKVIFDRNVPVFMGESPKGMPIPKNRGKKAAVVTACAIPWLLDLIAGERRGTIRAV